MSIPCDGCGATADYQRCVGCMHDFGTLESTWVKPYNEKGRTTMSDPRDARIAELTAELAVVKAGAGNAATHYETALRALQSALTSTRNANDRAREALLAVMATHGTPHKSEYISKDSYEAAKTVHDRAVAILAEQGDKT